MGWAKHCGPPTGSTRASCGSGHTGWRAAGAKGNVAPPARGAARRSGRWSPATSPRAHRGLADGLSAGAALIETVLMIVIIVTLGLMLWRDFSDPSR